MEFICKISPAQSTIDEKFETRFWQIKPTNGFLSQPNSPKAKCRKVKHGND